MPIPDTHAVPGPDLDWEAFLGDAPKVPFTVQRFFSCRKYLDYAGGPCTDLLPHLFTPFASAIGLKFPSRGVVLNALVHLHAKDISVQQSRAERGKVTGTPVGCACGDGVIDWTDCDALKPVTPIAYGVTPVREAAWRALLLRQTWLSARTRSISLPSAAQPTPAPG